MPTKGKVRRIYIPARLKEECANVWGELEDRDFLILNKQGNKMTSRGFASMMKKHASMYGLPLEKMHPHAFRHMFAIEFLKRNNNISLLADIMGHSGVNTTMIYTRQSEQEQRQEFNKAINW
jgi:site-specific recombinase XerD